MSDELFPARPGGIVHSTRQQAADAAAAAAAPTVASSDGPVPYTAVRVRPETPDLSTARTLTLSAANPVLTLVPHDPQRRQCVVIAVDNDVYISGDYGLALSISGGASAEGAFYLPAGIGIPVDTQAQLWVAATTLSVNSRVSVLITKDSAP